MSVRNTASKRPWAGIAAVVAALVVAVALLTGSGLWSGAWFQPWYLTRAAGLLAYLLLWASVTLGLLQSLGMLKGLTAPVANLDVHQFVSLGAIYATVFHAVVLLYDRYVPFTISELLVPFASDYKPVLVTLGIMGLYLMLLVTVTTYLRSRLSPRTWRSIHLTSLVAFAFALLHGLLLGTDATHPVVAFAYRFTAILTFLLVAYRLFKGVWAHHAHPAGRG